MTEEERAAILSRLRRCDNLLHEAINEGVAIEHLRALRDEFAALAAEVRAARTKEAP